MKAGITIGIGIMAAVWLVVCAVTWLLARLHEIDKDAHSALLRQRELMDGVRKTEMLKLEERMQERIDRAMVINRDYVNDRIDERLWKPE